MPFVTMEKDGERRHRGVAALSDGAGSDNNLGRPKATSPSTLLTILAKTYAPYTERQINHPQVVWD